MGNFRDKAEQIKAEGEQARGNYTPRGVPANMYNFWLERTNSDHGQAVRNGFRKENFCHYWRVVFIWAPLFFIGEKMEKVIQNTWFHIALGVSIVGLVALGMAYSVDFRMIFLTVLGILAAGTAIVVGSIFVSEHWPESWSRKFSSFFAVTWPYFVGSLVLAFLFALGLNEGWVWPLGVVLVTAAAAAIIYGIVLLVERAEAKREAARLAERAKINAMTNEEYWEYVAARDAKRPPTKFDNFLQAIQDFVILIAQVVRVNKWKICPLVEVDNHNSV